MAFFGLGFIGLGRLDRIIPFRFNLFILPDTMSFVMMLGEISQRLEAIVRIEFPDSHWASKLRTKSSVHTFIILSAPLRHCD